MQLRHYVEYRSSVQVLADLTEKQCIAKKRHIPTKLTLERSLYLSQYYLQTPPSLHLRHCYSAYVIG